MILDDWIDDQSDQSIIIGCYFKSHIPLMNVLKEQKHQELLEILLSQHRFHTQPFAMDSFSIDLILVVDIPQSPDRVLKKSVSPLSMMRKKISPLVAEAYREALEKIEISTHESSDNLKYVRNIGGLRREEEQIVTANEWRQGEVMKSSYTGTGVKDLFTVNLNIVIYTLQKECGFNVEKYIINDKVFLLLNCQQENLRRAAVLHHIKKEVVYSQVDIYLNQPLDSKNRPISLNKKFKNLQNSFERKEGHTEQRLLFQNNSIDEELLKKYHRKLGDVQNYAHEIIDQVELSSWEIEKFERFMGEYVKLLRTFDQSPVTEEMTGNQREYLRKILNKEGRINEGAMKIFQEIKRKKEYFQNLTELVENSGYKTFSPSTIYTSFFELNKKKKYADRVRSLLMFKPLVSGPEGELQLFLRMERTRLSYLVLLEYFRIENFPQYGIEFYTLHNSFEKYGNTDKEVLEGVDGGLDGYNLEKSWSVFTPWNSNIKVIRDYLGESFAYFTFLKNQLIYALILLSPIALIAFLIIVLVLPLNITHNSHLDTFVFFTVYSFIILIWFSAYTIRQDQSQAFHFGTLRQTSIRKTPNFGYKSPYVRNLISDSVNQYKEVKSIFNKVKELLGLLFVIVLLCIDIGVFYGIRSWSLILQRQIPRSRLFFEWYSFIPLFTFFMGNHIVYMFGLKRLFKYITSLENNPNLQKDESSFEVKCLLFRIGVELIGPIDLMVVEALGNHNCYDSSCWNAYESFINIRYIVVFILLVVRFASLLIVKIINKVKVKEETEKDLKETQIRTEEQSKIKKLFVKIIKEYSKKQHSIDIEEEILILIQLALFSMIQPISALINLFMTLLDFYLQRLQILKIWRRPINTALSTPDYSILIKVPFYIFCSFNSWLLLVNFQDLEYVNPHFYLTFLRTPTKDAITTLKIIFAFFLFCLMLLFQFIFRKIYNSNNEYSQLIARKERKLANYLYKYKKMKGGTWSNAHKPIMHIGRVKF